MRKRASAITFQSKGRRPLGKAISAVLIDVPRRGNDRIDAEVRAKATPFIGGTTARLQVCVDRGSVMTAGSYQGTVRIYGPKVSDFDYAVIVTEKWPWQFAVALLVLAGGVFVLVAWSTESLTFDLRNTKGREKDLWISSLFGIAVAIAAMAPTFFGTYWNNPTWGSDPGAHISGLVTAGFTAALGGLALAKRLTKNDGGENGSANAAAERKDAPQGSPRAHSS
jgi:hypothetical protein